MPEMQKMQKCKNAKVQKFSNELFCVYVVEI